MSAAPADSMAWLPTDTTSILDAAIAYASHGFRVITVWQVRQTAPLKEDATCGCKAPDCASVGKHPIALRWQKKATSDVDAVRDARRHDPEANVGIALGGTERLIAVDIDGAAGRASWAKLERERGPFPETLTSQSGRTDGGEHRLYTVPEHLDISRIKNRAATNGLAGIDTRGANGQIVAPPSVHFTGAIYRWKNRAPIAKMPDGLFDALAAEPEAPRPTPPKRGNVVNISDAYVKKVIENAVREIAGCAPGSRNNLLFAKSCTCFEYCIGQGLSDSEAWSGLLAAGIQCGLQKREVEVTLTKARRQASRRPRIVPERAGRPAPQVPPKPPTPHDDDGVVLDPANPVDPSTPADTAPDWGGLLSRNAKGGWNNTFGNVCKILRHHTHYGSKLTFHEMRVSPVWNGVPMKDSDTGKIREHIEEEFFFPPADASVTQAVLTVAAERSAHPVRTYLSALKWDGEPRVVRVLPRILGINTHDPLQQRMLRCWFVSAVARAMQPGCKVDTALVLVGPQGYRKSTFFATLAGEWFSDSKMDITSKDGILQLHATWIYEWAEIESITTTKQASDVKGFITTAKDTIRLPYGRAVVLQPRSSVIVGTTNEVQFLSDPTGSRRFWVLPIGQTLDIRELGNWRDQLWAEAVDAYQNGEEWWLSKEDDDAREAAAEKYRVEDSWEEPIKLWLATAAGNDPTKPLTTHRIISEALKLDAAHETLPAMQRVGRCMRRLGFGNEHRVSAGDVRVRSWRKDSADLPEAPTG